MMLNPWLLLGTIAFISSFAVSVLLTRDLGGSLIAGVMALATAWTTAALVNGYHHRAVDHRLASLKQQIRQLQRRRTAEQQTIDVLMAEKERVAIALHSMQKELRQRQLPNSNPYATPPPSWDLTAESSELPAIAPSEQPDIQPEFHPAALTQFITEAAATKQKINASLNQLQSELNQLQAQVNQQRQQRQHLIQELQQLNQQKQQLVGTVNSLTQDIDQLEQQRQDLQQHIGDSQTEQHTLAAGTNPLQKATQQLKHQVAALQDELRSVDAQVTAKRQEKAALEQAANSSHVTQQKLLQATIQTLEQRKSQLEQNLVKLQQDHTQTIAQQQAHLQSVQNTLQKLDTQIRDRRQEKEALERQISQLQAEKTTLRQPATPVKLPDRAGKPVATNGHSPAAASSALERPAPPANRSSSPVPVTPANSELSDLWTEFMLQLPEYELEALRSITQEHNPTPILNRIAEANFTTPEELITSINQLAEEIVGARVIKMRGTAPPVILRDHQRTIKQLIATYEYLNE